MSDALIFQKSIDKSVLYEGINIPVNFQEIIYSNLGFKVDKGQKSQINLIIDNKKYPVEIKNIYFDPKKYPTHKDLLQIRYGRNSDIAVTLRSIFAKTNQKVLEYRATNNNTRRLLNIPYEEREYIAIYSTPVKGDLYIECITNTDMLEETIQIKQFDELTFENIIDSESTIVEKIAKQKYRKLSKAVGDSLKQLYGFKCQICGEYIGEKYGSNIIHAHHIDYFTRSFNNNSDNILIVCPNHHGIIHDRNPEFNRRSKEFIYPNGYHEGLVLNKHL